MMDLVGGSIGIVDPAKLVVDAWVVVVDCAVGLLGIVSKLDLLDIDGIVLVQSCCHGVFELCVDQNCFHDNFHSRLDTVCVWIFFDSVVVVVADDVDDGDDVALLGAEGTDVAVHHVDGANDVLEGAVDDLHIGGANVVEGGDAVADVDVGGGLVVVGVFFAADDGDVHDVLVHSWCHGEWG